MLVAARSAVKRGGTGRDRFRVAAMHQRAAGLALKRGAPRVALHLTRRARDIGRRVIALNRVAAPARAADRPGEFDGASGQDARRFLSMVRRNGSRARLYRTLGRSQDLLGHAARSARRGGKGKLALRRAAVYQRAARAARQRGDGKAALHLTARARTSAREAIAANGSEAPPDTRDQAGEFEGASAEGTDEYVSAAESSLPSEVNEQEIASWDQQATDDLGEETAAENDQTLDVETYEYEIDGEADPAIEGDAAEGDAETESTETESTTEAEAETEAEVETETEATEAAAAEGIRSAPAR